MSTDQPYVPSVDEVRTVWAAWSEYGGLTERTDDTTDTTDTTDTERYAEVDRFLARVRRDAWAEGYGQGVDDTRTADHLRVDVGLGPDLYAQPARQNPYEETP